MLGQLCSAARAARRNDAVTPAQLVAGVLQALLGGPAAGGLAVGRAARRGSAGLLRGFAQLSLRRFQAISGG